MLGIQCVFIFFSTTSVRSNSSSDNYLSSYMREALEIRTKTRTGVWGKCQLFPGFNRSWNVSPSFKSAQMFSGCYMRIIREADRYGEVYRNIFCNLLVANKPEINYAVDYF
jgi:hypothetical protein